MIKAPPTADIGTEKETKYNGKYKTPHRWQEKFFYWRLHPFICIHLQIRGGLAEHSALPSLQRIVLCGERQRHLCGRRKGFPVCKNDMVIINPHVQHTEKSLRTSPLDYIVLGIDGLAFSCETIASAQDSLSLHTPSGMVYKCNMPNSKVYAYLNIMLEEISRKEENYEAVCQNLLEVLLLCMLRNDNLSIVQSSNTLLNRECAQIKNYLDAHYAENITLDTLVEITHMNKYYMVHAFTRYAGLSPINYLLQKRIQEGKALLESTTYSIAQISTLLGFSSQSYFSQAFKKATGKTPIAHRNEYQKQQRK